MIWEFDFSSQKYPEIDDYSYFSETYNSEDLQLPFTIKGGVLIDLLVRLPPAFTLDCKEMPIDRSFHVVCHRHVNLTFTRCTKVNPHKSRCGLQSEAWSCNYKRLGSLTPFWFVKKKQIRLGKSEAILRVIIYVSQKIDWLPIQFLDKVYNEDFFL